MVTPTPVTDLDGDGFPASVDCNDENKDVHPGATEICNEVDDNCDGTVDEGVTLSWYVDADADGYGAGDLLIGCKAPADSATLAGDCDDTRVDVNPGAMEICDAADNDCNEEVDDGLDFFDYWLDGDQDGYGAGEVVSSCIAMDGYADVDGDCDDEKAEVHPDASETCNEIDDDCDGESDEGVTTTYYPDEDGDGYGQSLGADDPGLAHACVTPDGYADVSGDCRDDLVSVNPAAEEICDGGADPLDNNCDGQVDEGVPTDTYYLDGDGDGFGDPASGLEACAKPEPYIEQGGDCDDYKPEINPDAAEICDGIDNNCDDIVDNENAVLGSALPCAAQTCMSIVDARPDAPNGTYFIDLPGSGPLEVACNMTFDGGGWTLAAVESDDGQTTWTWNTRRFWDTDRTTFGSLETLNRDFKSLVLHDLPFTDVLFIHQPSGIWASYHDVGDGFESMAEFIGGLGESVCWTGTDGYPLSAGTLFVGGGLCNTQLFFNAKDHDGKSTCSSHDDAHGPVWSTVNNASCPFDDPGHAAMGPNKLYPTEERIGTGYGGWIALNLNTGPAGAAVNYLQMYVR